MTDNHAVQPWEIPDLQLHRLISVGNKIKRTDCIGSIRIAILSDAASQHYCKALSSACKIKRYWPEIYDAEYDTIQQEVRDYGSRLYRHSPDFIVFFTCAQALWTRFHLASDSRDFAEVVFSELSSLWETAKGTSGATVVQHNFAIPVNLPYGNYTSSCPASFVSCIQRLNSMIAKEGENGSIRVVDTEFQSAYYGKRLWLDERLWCQAKQALSPKFLPALVKSTSDIILAERGVGIKCVVVDLDNTLWGGILSDDGPEQIEIGQTELGLVFGRFQTALVELRRRGLLLAVCSKNHREAVLSVLDNHPDMLLRSVDFVAIEASYGDKVSGIRAIRERLNIGFESMVFLDDSAFERNFVREALPELQVPELSDDPANYLTDLARWNLFEGSSSTPEDLARHGYYQADESRAEMRASCGTLAEFIESLQMEAEVLPLNSYTLPRAHQLVQRSNQFNLTTIRYREAELADLGNNPDICAFCIRLADRLGDNGIISFVILRTEPEAIVVDTWIMSCRVLGRRVEELTVQLMVEYSRARGRQRIVGQYKPTSKNRIVENVYIEHGFLASGCAGDTLCFTLDVEHFVSTDLPIKIRRLEMVN